jgi:hypothetical protein
MQVVTQRQALHVESPVLYVQPPQSCAVMCTHAHLQAPALNTTTYALICSELCWLACINITGTTTHRGLVQDLVQVTASVLRTLVPLMAVMMSPSTKQPTSNVSVHATPHVLC